jgi:hypothetical protein
VRAVCKFAGGDTFPPFKLNLGKLNRTVLATNDAKTASTRE